MGDTSSVTWLPAHPFTGSISMQRYWQELQHAAVALGVKIDCPFHHANLIQQVGRLKRTWGVYVSYPVIASKVSTDLVHILDHSSAQLIPYLPSHTKVIVSVHDLFPLVDSAGMTSFQHWRICNRLKLLKRADRLVTVSDFAKQQLMDLMDIPPAKIDMIHNGYSSLNTQMTLESEIQLPQREEKSIFILSVGNCSQRKNLAILPEVMKGLSAMQYSPVLLRVGDYLPDELRVSLRASLGVGKFIEFGRVDDAVLNALYRKSDLLFFPSWAEGFGLPLLEAMGKGCPVVSSNTTSLPEVGGNAVLYFDPSDPAEACEKIVSLQNSSVRSQYIEAGYDQIKKFSWEQYVLKLIEIYKNISD